MSERFVSGVSAKIALYKYSYFPFLLQCLYKSSYVCGIVGFTVPLNTLLVQKRGLNQIKLQQNYTKN